MQSPPIPKAALYYSPGSIWASAALLALEEKGYGPEEVDLKIVDLAKGENFAPSFLRLNPKATVPTLVVPIEKTLSAEVDSRYKALTDTTAIVQFLDKSRSSVSRTHTTSTAPAPSLSPATPAFAAASTAIISLLHSPTADPNSLFYLAARTPAELAALSSKITPFLKGRVDALAQLLADAQKSEDDGGIHVTDKVQMLWQEKKAATDAFYAVIKDGQKSEGELDDAGKMRRKEYLDQAEKAWDALKPQLAKLDKEIIGPFVLGDQVSLADLHLAAWLARIVHLAGGSGTDQGTVAIAKLEAHVTPDGSFVLPANFAVTDAQSTPTIGAVPNEPREPQKVSKLAAFWDVMRERPSWSKVYGNGLH